jgi:proteasome lid subunit RPN8/RPN11
MPELVISREHLELMVTHCRAHHPNEACGLLAGKGSRVTKVYPMANTEPSPVSYFMEPKEQFRAMKEMRQEGLTMLAIFHSHPQSPAYPSVKDVSLAFYEDAVYLIISLMNPKDPVIKAFTIVDGAVNEAPFSIDPA